MDNTFTDQELLKLMSENDRGAFNLIYRKYWKGLYLAAYKRLRNQEQSEDIVQEVFIKFWIRRAELKIENLSAYLQTAVRYQVYNYVSRDLVNKAFYEPFEALTTLPVSADNLIIEKELLQLAVDYITALPRKKRQIFLLHMNENLSTNEIAARLNISRKTVQNQLSVAMSGLREAILPVVFILLLSVC